MRRIPYQFTNIFLQGSIGDTPPEEAKLNLRNVKISNMSWVEYGLNFGMMAKKHNGVLISAGGNLKYLNGINLFYADLIRLNGYIKDTLIDIKNLRGKVRMAQ